METLKPQESKRLTFIATCTDCEWFSRLPVMPFKEVENIERLKNNGHQHEKRFRHTVKFSTQ